MKKKATTKMEEKENKMMVENKKHKEKKGNVFGNLNKG